MFSTVQGFYEHSLLKNARAVLIIAQIACLIPVSGILNNDLHAIEFSYVSVRVVLSVIVQASVACMAVSYSVVFLLYDCRLRAAGI